MDSVPKNCVAPAVSKVIVNLFNRTDDDIYRVAQKK